MILFGANSKKRVTQTAAALLTAGLACLLLFFFYTFEYPRTLRRALEKIDGEPLSFSAGSGFYEDGFRLELTADDRIPVGKGIEIRYTVDGDEPTAESLLYDPAEGIDLQSLAEEAVRSERLQTVEMEAAREEAQAEMAAAAGEAAAAEAAGTEAGAAEQASAAGTAQAESIAAADTAAAPPTIDEARDAWEKEKWLLASDAGVYPVRTEDGIAVVPVRVCLLQGEDRSRVVTRTYVIGKNAAGRYRGDFSIGTAAGEASAGEAAAEKTAAGKTAAEKTAAGKTAAGETAAGKTGGTGIYVVSVTTDSRNLFDYESGIMVKGSHYEKDVAEGVREDRAGNFFQTGPEWVKDGHVTLFSPAGEVLLEEDTGLTISGYSSRTLTTRSFRAEASAEHGTPDPYFHLKIFADAFPEGAAASAGGSPGTETAEETAPAGSSAPVRADASIDLFQKIKFRSHGVPGYHIRSVRNQYAKVLTDECGFPGLVENRLAVMFLNGEFYTVCDITPSTTKDYLARLFHLHVPDAVEKLEGSDYDVYTQGRIVNLLEADLTDADNQKALEEAVDMDNYLFYMALEVLLNNADWPFNNVTMWRYLGEEDPSNPYSDGRYRFILDDMDQILSNGLHGDPARWSSELIDYLMKDKGHTFHHVMACKKYRDAFLTYVDDLLQTAFEPEHACRVLDALYSAMTEEYLLDYGEEFWAEMEETAEITKQNVREKESLYRANIEKYMDLTDRAPVRIEASDGVTVTWNHRTVSPGGSWSGEYYCGIALELTASPSEGYRFAGWEADGVLLSEDSVYAMEVKGAGEEVPQTIRALAEPVDGGGE